MFLVDFFAQSAAIKEIQVLYSRPLKTRYVSSVEMNSFKEIACWYIRVALTVVLRMPGCHHFT